MTSTRPSETFTVELSVPSGTTLADSTGLGTIAADATPALSIADAVNVAEGRDAVFRVTLRPAANHVVSVAYATMDGTAVADADYTPVTGTLRFEPRETTKTIRVPVLLDTMTEESETFTVELSNPGGSTLADPIGVGTIRADPAPGLRIGDATPVAEGHEAVFTVTLTPPGEQVVTVNYTTADGTAIADEDYTATSGTLRFAPGDTSKTIRVPVLEDATAEPVETFTVVLSNPAGTNVVPRHGGGNHYGRRVAGIEHRRRADRSRRGRRGIPGNPESDQQPGGDGRLCDARRNGGRGLGLHRDVRDAALRARRDDADHPGADAPGHYRRAERELYGGAERPGRNHDHGRHRGGNHYGRRVAGIEHRRCADRSRRGRSGIPGNPESGQQPGRDGRLYDAGRNGVADSDYTATSGTLRFEPGETMQTIRVPTRRDAIAEPSESFTVELSDPVGTTITNASGVGTIAADAMPGLSIADAAPVAEGGEATFTVSLNPASSELVTVAYATQDGTAVAGSDYTAASGTLKFEPGVTSHTIRVAILDDAATEPTETFTVELSDPVRATLADGTGVGTITDDVEHRVERAIRTGLPEIGRAMAFSAVTCRIDRKMSDTRTWDNAGRRAGGGFPPAANFGGHAAFGGPGTTFGGSTGAFGDSSFPTDASTTPGQQLGNLSFLMASQEAAEGGGGRVAAWGCGDYRRLSGAGGLGAGSWNGEVYSLHVGVDVRLGSNVLAGVSVSRSRGMIDYEGGLGSGTDGGEHDLRLVGVHPFLGWSVTPGLQLWGTVGHAWGELRIVDELGGLTGAATLNSGALGLNGRLLARGATTLSLRGEGALAQLTADSATFEVATIDMWRFRLTTELSHELLFSSGTSLTPWAELGVRHDGGDGQTGAGLEMGGGLRYRVPQVGLTAEGYGRWLAVHEGTLQEWGVGAMVTIDPGMDRRGVSASVTPSWGETASGVQRLWQQGAAGPAYGTSRAQVDAQLGYGVPVFGGRSVLTPFGAMNLAGDEARRYRLGGSLAASRWTTLSLEIERWERALTDAMHSVMVRGAVEF